MPRTAIIAIALVVTLLGSASAQDFQKGVDAYRRGDYAAAFRELRPLADQGHAVAQFNLGVMCDKGQGVPQDYAEAFRWNRKAAEQGNARAQATLALMYRKGQSVPQDNMLAYLWANLAAAQGNESLARLRNVIAEALTPQQIAEAQRMSSICAASNYKKCGY